MRRLRWFAVLCVLVMVAAACGRDSETTDAPEDTTETSAGSTDGPTDPDDAAADLGLDDGAFGDLGVLCQPAAEGEANAAGTEPGVTADSIQISTFSDPGFTGRLGLNQEMFDTAEAFTNWCNEHGGINGRQINLKLRDAKLFEFQQRIIEACDEGDFFMVGGGNVFDDTGQGERLGCELPQVPAYVVTPQAAESDLTQQPIPNPGDQQPVGGFNYLGEEFPESKSAVGIFTGDIQTTITVADRNKEALGILGGWDIVYEGKYNPLGETSWRTYIEAMRSAGVRGLVYVGEPSNLAAFLTEAAGLDLTFDWVWSAANIYDKAVEDEAGANADGLYITTAFYPFLGDAASGNPATQQYVDLIDQYKPGGKIANLGVQALSAWLLFAKAAGECGAEITRDCVWTNVQAVEEWTGGGLNAPQDLSSGDASTCGSLLVVEGGTFELADIGATDGIYLCDDANIVTLVNDYGSGVTCPNPAYASDPKPSNCA